MPREAILNWNVERQTAEVFVARGDKAEKRAVKTGLTSGESVEIVSGVEAGDAGRHPRRVLAAAG